MNNINMITDNISVSTALNGVIRSIASKLSLDDDQSKSEIIDFVYEDPNLKHITKLIKKDEEWSKAYSPPIESKVLTHITSFRDKLDKGEITLIELLKQYQELIYSIIGTLEKRVLKSKRFHEKSEILTPIGVSIKA